MKGPETKAPCSGILLCAGEGRRLRPLTLVRPKPLVPLHGIPLAEFGLRFLLEAGCDPIAINGWHLAEQIEAWVEELRRRYPERRFLFFREERLLGTGGSLQQMLPRLPAGPVLVQNGDVLHDADPALLLKDLPQEEIRLLSTSGPPVLEGREGQVLSLRDPARSNRGFAGVHAIGAEARKALLDDGPADVVERWQAFIALNGAPRLGATLHDGFWKDIGRLAEYLPFHWELARDPAYLALCRRLDLHADVDPERKVSPAAARLGEGSREAVLWHHEGWPGRVRRAILCRPGGGNGNLEGEILL